MKRIYTRVVIVANGTLEKDILNEIRVEDYSIGVDRAAFWLLSHNVRPNLAIGDFDSCIKEEIFEIQQKIPDTRIFSAEKDFTDTELAFDVALMLSPEEILILGGSGTRTDHMLATLSLLEKGLRRHIRVFFQDRTNQIQLISRGRTILRKREEDKYVSVIPYTKTISLSLTGFKYPLNNARIVRGQTIGISNEIIENQAVVDIHRGLALVIQSRD